MWHTKCIPLSIRIYKGYYNTHVEIKYSIINYIINDNAVNFSINALNTNMSNNKKN